MKSEKRLRMSKRELARVQVVEFGKILFNLQIAFALIVASPLPFVVYPLYYAGLVLISVFTGFAIFLAYSGFAALWRPVKIYKVLTALLGAWKVTVPIAIGVSLLTILCLCLDKKEKHKKRIIASIVVIVMVLLYMTLRLSIANFGGVAQ